MKTKMKNNSTTKQILNFIIKEKSQGNSFQELNVQMKIMMKGINVKGILEEKISEEISKALTEKLKDIAREFDVDLEKMAD
jgi:hypothetical protein